MKRYTGFEATTVIVTGADYRNMLSMIRARGTVGYNKMGRYPRYLRSRMD